MTTEYMWTKSRCPECGRYRFEGINGVPLGALLCPVCNNVAHNRGKKKKEWEDKYVLWSCPVDAFISHPDEMKKKSKKKIIQFPNKRRA